MHSIDIPELVNTLIDTGTNTWDIEAKDARGGLPNTIDETLCAFANMPEGGTIVLGMSETPEGMGITGVHNPAELIQGLASKACERIVPPVQLGASE
ncbi:helix-turn-helix domain-containing protein [Corynebacterium pilosum]|uniref:Putative transcriptional regulator n=1 Tax=Corynebacterium pilosum TaxID=35756 RepID=A0A376CMI8_9CORY|nr:RNA-binding domain-containing protein [Corynebacterium pilosum]STC69309.1 putative transcriptional regulator [Corynebacterium pilosum]